MAAFTRATRGSGMEPRKEDAFLGNAAVALGRPKAGGLGCRLEGLGLWGYALGFRVWGFGFRVSGLGFRV